MDIKGITELAQLGLLAVGAFVAYRIYTDISKPTGVVSEAVVPVAEAIGTTVTGITNTVFVPNAGTVGCGERCVNNADCSSTGVAGGRSVGIDLIGGQDFGCCGGKCKEKKQFGLIKVCPGPRAEECRSIQFHPMDPLPSTIIQQPAQTVPLGGRCSQTSDCSANEVRGGPPSDGTNTVCNNNYCYKRDQIEINSMFRSREDLIK